MTDAEKFDRNDSVDCETAEDLDLTAYEFTAAGCVILLLGGLALILVAIIAIEAYLAR